MRIHVNEKAVEVAADSSLAAIRAEFKPTADLIIVNGYPVDERHPLVAGDRVVLISRGAIPSAAELETLLVARHTPGVHARVKQARVGIAGVGGLGSAIAVALTRLGIGELIIADFDVVEPSNLNRQQYFVDQLGMPKVAALAENLRRINPYVSVITHTLRLTRENIPGLFAEVDVMVEAFDAAAQKALLVESFLTMVPGRPLVAASGMAGFGPSNTILTRRAGTYLYLVGDEVTAAAPGSGLMAPRVGIAAHHQANCVLRLLLGEDPLGDPG
jgi:sulfur carrier protein ThiS adenylyltransferase